MNTLESGSLARLRWSVYILLIVVGAAGIMGRILAIDSIDKLRLEEYRLGKIQADLAAKRKNLTSKGLAPSEIEKELARAEAVWTERAKLRRPFLSANDRSRWATVRALVEDDMRVEGAPYAIDKVIQQPNWDTIDMVQCRGHLYSSKPPLLPTLMAAVYWPIHRWTGATLGKHPHEIGRCMLVVFNLAPLIVCFLLLASLIERFGTTDWGRLFVMASAVFGTFLTTFAVTINNHLPAAVMAAGATYAAIRIWFDGERRLRFFVAAGLCAGLAAANEFPAVALLAAVAWLLFAKAPRAAFCGFAPSVLLVAVVFFGTNWIAFQSLKPAYLHRSGTDNWYDYTYQRDGRTLESYWKNPRGIDRGEPSWSIYACNVLVGHHGIFSLTPVWLLSAVGMGIWTMKGQDPRLRWLGATLGAVSLACLVFYLGQPVINRNYGGATCGLRWMFWLVPLWLTAMTPAADAVASRRWTRGLALLLLGVSVLSVCYPTWNPWTHPWLMDFSNYLGWGD